MEHNLIRIMPPALLAAGALLAGPGAIAAEGESAPQRSWTNTAEVGFVQTSGNSETTNIKLSDKFVRSWDGWQLEINALALRAEQTTRSAANVAGALVVTETSATTAETYQLAGLLRRDIRDGFYWLTGLEWTRNRPSGLDNRYQAQAGLGYRFFKTDVHELQTELGVTYTDESFVSGTDPMDQNYAGARAFAGYSRKLSPTATFTQTLELLENLDDTADWRGKSETAVTASITSQVALKASFTLLYDNRPVVQVLSAPGFNDVRFEFDSTDTILAASLVVNF
ncbi:MAG: DUF481 domain-containing protein [Acidobacteria bacterium]|nr:MAG: DUF481 domain-containing protein [Acidobacteriota bacterium]